MGTQGRPDTDTTLRIVDGRRADSDRVLRKFALSAAIEIAPPGSDAKAVVMAAQRFLNFLRLEEAQPGACAHCGAAYLTGPGTGHRSHRRYCSDACRVAAMRERHREAEQ
jgi:hypothetical protein